LAKNGQYILDINYGIVLLYKLKENRMKKIKLTDVLKIENLDNVKIRFNLQVKGNWNPIDFFKNNEIETLLTGQYWNYKDKKSFKDGQITIGFIKIDDKKDLWLLFHVGQITKDLNILDGVGYEYVTLDDYSKYFGRLIIKYKNKITNMIRNANSVIDECEVEQILPDRFDNDIFPGYDRVNISWEELSRVIEKENWITALQNQKGVYLITDVENGKKYVGSAYGDNMILGRWQSYIKTGHGGNVGLKKLPFDYIKNNFRFTILDIFKSTTDDDIIINRENWWKDVLQSRRHGYNEN
jgi:hypothetical protein